MLSYQYAKRSEYGFHSGIHRFRDPDSDKHSTGFSQANKLGIAKNQWGVDELKEIIDNNSFYVKNCIGYRDNLTNVHSAQLLTDIYKKSIQKQ